MDKFKKISLSYSIQDLIDKPYCRWILIFSIIIWDIMESDIDGYERDPDYTIDEVNNLRKAYYRAYRKIFKDIEKFFKILNRKKRKYRVVREIYQYVPYFIYSEMVSGRYSFEATKELFENNLPKLKRMAKKGEKIYQDFFPEEYFYYIEMLLSWNKYKDDTLTERILQEEILEPKDIKLAGYICKEVLDSIPESKIKAEFVAFTTIYILSGDISLGEYI